MGCEVADGRVTETCENFSIDFLSIMIWLEILDRCNSVLDLFDLGNLT